MLLLCGMLPEPMVLSTVAAAKNTASHLKFRRRKTPPARVNCLRSRNAANGAADNPRSMKYMGPPQISPLSSLIRYLCEIVTSTNLVVMPTNAVAHIQKSAAGPPRKMANATPPMLPVPTVPDSAVESACKWVVSPSASDRVWCPNKTPQARLK